MPALSHDAAAAAELVRRHALVPCAGATLARTLFDAIDPDAQVVMIGEASHGTHEFYEVRAEVTKMLIAERGFAAVCLEADFPDAARANLFVRGLSADKDADAALSDFVRFPTWMWRNEVMRDFVSWLREHNDGARAAARAVGGGDEAAARATAGLYGLDVYSLHTSARQVVEFLKGVDPEAAKRVEARYHCFDRYGEDAQAYGLATGLGGYPSCADAAARAARDVIAARATLIARADGVRGEELAFAAACNAAVVRDAEKYYRNMFFAEELTWNLRDTHFAEVVALVERHLAPRAPGGAPPRLVLWAHNSHLGDASFTDMGRARGEVNVGQLLRERLGRGRVVNLGFTTHAGSVAAADTWDAPCTRKAVRRALPGSYEALFHAAGLPEFALDLRRGPPALVAALRGPLLERAIGVIYRPQTERQSHYFRAELPAQFDYVAHIDRTQAVRPLERAHASWLLEKEAGEEVPETWPTGL